MRSNVQAGPVRESVSGSGGKAHARGPAVHGNVQWFMCMGEAGRDAARHGVAVWASVLLFAMKKRGQRVASQNQGKRCLNARNKRKRAVGS